MSEYQFFRKVIGYYEKRVVVAYDYTYALTCICILISVY